MRTSAVLVAMVVVLGLATVGVGVALVQQASSGPAPVSLTPFPTTALPPGSPVLVDTAGRALPESVALAVRRLDGALVTGDLGGLRELCSSAPGATPWAVVVSRVADDGDRVLLLRALRHAPRPGPPVAWLYTEGDHGLGIDESGLLAFVGP